MQPSPRGFTRKEILLGLAIIASALTALGLNSYRKVNQHGEDEVVLCLIRQLSAAADQYYLENGVSTADLGQLVGATNYIKAIATVAGETYPAHYTRGLTITVTGIGGSRTVTYAP